MSRFLTTLPINLGFVNFGTVEAYPTGGTGPTAYGPTSYYGSDPLPPRLGDSINNPIDLGNFTSIYRTITISNQHGGLSRQQTSFYCFTLLTPRSIKVSQNYSQFSTTNQTNKNTLIAFYRVENGTHRTELPINNLGYVIEEASIEKGDTDSYDVLTDYPISLLKPGKYIFLITNDIRYLETTYSITLESFINDWRFVNESVDQALNFGTLTETVESTLDFGLLLT